MNGVNKAIVVGTVGYISYKEKDGFKVCNFSLATNSVYKDKNTGEKVSNVTWHKFCAYNKLADICNNLLEKGCRVYAEGEMCQKTYMKDNRDVIDYHIKLMNMQLISGKNKEKNDGNLNAYADDYEMQSMGF